MSDGYRTAALALHALAEQDRTWVLGRLGAPERARLASLLAELQDLGLTADLNGVEAPGSEPRPNTRPLDNAPAAAMAEALLAEPDWLIAAVVRARRWPWREDFLRLLGTERRLQVDGCVSRDIQMRPKAVEALVAAVEARIGRQ